MGDLWSALAKANTLIDFIERTGGPSGADRARYETAVSTVRNAEAELAGGGSAQLGVLPFAVLAALGVLTVIATAVGGAVTARVIMGSAKTAGRAAEWGIWMMLGAGAVFLAATVLPKAARAYRSVRTA